MNPKTILETYSYYEIHNDICERIIKNSTSFIKKLTYEYAVKEYIIH